MSLDRPIEGSWLAARREADSRARLRSAPLVQTLADRLQGLDPGGHGVTFVDLGSGTGANPAWLAPQVARARAGHRVPSAGSPAPQHWLLVDHDADLLTDLDLGADPAAVTSYERVVGSTADLGQLLTGAARPVVVTCSALLDLLTPDELTALARAVTTSADAALLTLSVTGAVRFTPAHQDDDLVATAFDRHQQRTVASSGVALAGPGGARLAVAAFESRGWQVHTADTPWTLGAPQQPLLHRWLAERVAAALEALHSAAGDRPTADRVRAWWRVREQQTAGGALTVEVHHLDLLALPPAVGQPRTS